VSRVFAGAFATIARVFSSRLNWDARPNPLSELLDQKLEEGAPVLDLTESNPTHAGLDYPGDEIIAAAYDKAILRYDPDPRGAWEAREAVAVHYAALQLEIDPSRILLTASTSEAYAYLFKLLMGPGDEVLVPRPSYPLFQYLAAVEAVSAKTYSLGYDGEWHIDFASLEAAFSPRTRAIAVVNPNNPTGSFLKQEERERLEMFAAQRGIAILSDEVFSDYGFGEDTRRVTSMIHDRQTGPLTFSMSGLSKVCGLPQMKLGWIVASGDESENALNGLEWIADTFLSVATPVQIALPRLLAAGESVRAQIQERTSGNLAFLEEFFGEGSAARPLHIEGGWYAPLQVPRTRSEEDWVLSLLRDEDVRVQPGFFYDFESEAYLILSLLTESTLFEEGVRRIGACIE